jgi:ATP-dependent DNA ligase
MFGEEFVVVGWSDPEGSRHRIGALLLGFYTPAGDLIYAGRVGTGMSDRELERLVVRSASAARRFQDGTGGTITSRRSLRFTARAFAGALGAPGDGRGSLVR